MQVQAVSPPSPWHPICGPHARDSCTGASITRDDARNHAIYGEDVLAADVIAGRVPPPPEVPCSLPPGEQSYTQQGI